MKKLLYITASPKPETESSSKQAGRAFVAQLMEKNTDFELEELDLPTAGIPMPNQRYYKGRIELVSGLEYDVLSEHEKADVDRINQLCTQFQQADCYVVASPMWSLSFPAILKQYLDCILLNNRVIRITDTDIKGLLCDKPRKMVYIQTSGGIYPKIFYSQMNYGVKYFHDIFTHLGIKEFYRVLIQGTDMKDVGKARAFSEASDDFECALSKMQFQKSREPISV